MACEYKLNSSGRFTVTEEALKDFREHGYIIVRDLFDCEEVRLLRECVEADKEATESNNYSRDDGSGKKVLYTLWDHPADDITGAIARSEKVAATFNKLLGDEVYHYHGKLILKDAHTGGQFVWHQDYGYWYDNGCLFPDMGTVFIPIDDTDQQNGCLKIVPKSHLAGRINHGLVGDQAGADIGRVNYLVDKLGVKHCELKAGDAMFFHCNILHRSEQNNSDRRRWAYLIAYCTKFNNPVIEHHCPRYTPLSIIPNYQIKSYAGKVGKKLQTCKDRSYMADADKCQPTAN